MFMISTESISDLPRKSYLCEASASIVPSVVEIADAVIEVQSDVTAAALSVGMLKGWANHFSVKPLQTMLYLPWVSLKPNSTSTRIGAKSHRITRCAYPGKRIDISRERRTAVAARGDVWRRFTAGAAVLIATSSA